MLRTMIDQICGYVYVQPRAVLCLAGLMGVLVFAFAGTAHAAECIVPAQPKGGFDTTCKLLQEGLQRSHAYVDPMSVVDMPGGVGAVAFNAIITRRDAEPNTLVAFSGGSLFNIVQGNFGKYTDRDVKWLSAIGLDYGVLVVRRDSPLASLKDLVAKLSREPDKVVFGFSGTTGSQDWTKIMLVGRAAHVNSKSMRFVGFEGGGEASVALAGGYVDVVSGDMSEAFGLIQAGAPLRILVVFSGKRLTGALKDIMTAKEQGYDIEWPNIRGLYMGPHVPDADYQRWVATINRMLVHPEFASLREESGLAPFAMTGAPLNNYIRDLVKKYRRMINQSNTFIQTP